MSRVRPTPRQPPDVIVPKRGENLLPVHVVRMRIPETKVAYMLGVTRAPNAMEILNAMEARRTEKKGRGRPRQRANSSKTIDRDRHIAYEVVRLRGLRKRGSAWRVEVVVGKAFGKGERLVEDALSAHRAEATENQDAYVIGLTRAKKIPVDIDLSKFLGESPICPVILPQQNS